MAALVWERFGDVPNYVEPFAGSLAVLLDRPAEPRTETVNDVDAYLANFWRAVKADPDGVAHYADWPVNEADLHARHLWLVTTGAERAQLLQTDKDFYDVEVAGLWVWGLSQWIGSGWCVAQEYEHHKNVRPGLSYSHGANDVRVYQKRPGLGNAGRGVVRKIPKQMPGLSETWGVHQGRAVVRQIPTLQSRFGVIAITTTDGLTVWMRALCERLRRVRVCCGDWTRVMGSSVTWKQGVTAMFLDPPYARDGRDSDLYAHESDVAADVREWAIANGDNPLLRIALCGYAGEHDMPPSWEVVRWKTNGGYGSQGTGRGRENAARETIWFSPACLSPGAVQGRLFELAAD